MADSAVDGGRTVEALNLKYIELLEKRIAQLETQVSKAEPEKAAEKEDEIKPDGQGEEKSEKVDGSIPDEKKDDQGGGEKRYRYILRKWDKNAGAHKDEEVGPEWFNQPKNKDSVYVYRRIYDPETGEKGAYSEIEIEDPELIKLLKEEIGKYPGVSFDTDTVTMTSPFPAIVHNWDKLHERVNKSPESQGCKDLKNLLDLVRSTPELDGYFKLRGGPGQEEGIKAVTFDTLWTVFAPDTLIVVRAFRNIPQIMSVADSFIPYLATERYSKLFMWAWTWDYDGHNLVKVWHEFKIDRFRGTKNISELPYVPLDVYADAETLKETVRKRSQKFIQYTVQCKEGSDQVFQYDGLAYADERKTLANDEAEEKNRLNEDDNADYNPPQDDEGSAASKLVHIKGEVISDAQAYTQNASSAFPIGERGRAAFIDRQQAASDETDIFRDVVKKLKADEPLDRKNNNFLLMPPRVLGYATRQRVWGQFHLDSTKVKDAANPKAFKVTLQLSQRYKDMIESLVASHVSKTRKPIKDIIEEKGKGLVLLLHGPPGVGKTLTAEAVARATGKPLFVVSVAEIGLDASRAERKLERIFALATKWQAVLLIDEADVFLETRNRHSPPQRNALVSVLLRVLEYYEGIIMMTTNRIKAIDVAVISRIHLAVRYMDLDPDQMRNIFNHYLEQLRPELVHDLPAIQHFINTFGHMYALNGRQIRNVVMAAQAYASQSLNLGELETKVMALTHQAGPGYENTLGPPYPAYGTGALAGSVGPGYGAAGPGYGGYGPPGGGQFGGGYGNNAVANMGGYSPVPRREDGRMTADHLRAVCELTREFQEQLKEESKDQRYANEAR